MKKYLVLMIASSLIAGVSCQVKIDMEKETDAINKVIEDEIRASFNGDYETRTTVFVHEPYLLWLQATKTGYRYFNGRDDLISEAKNL